MSYAISVMVVDKSSGKGKPGHKVKCYNGVAVKTDSNGKATVVVDGSSTNIYVDGFEVYKGSSSSAPNPIIVRK